MRLVRPTSSLKGEEREQLVVVPITIINQDKEKGDLQKDRFVKQNFHHLGHFCETDC